MPQTTSLHDQINMSFLQVCSDSDYETWSPPDNDRCLLGTKVTMQRRKQSAECFNDKGWARGGSTTTSCQCSHVSMCFLPALSLNPIRFHSPVQFHKHETYETSMIHANFLQQCMLVHDCNLILLPAKPLIRGQPDKLCCHVRLSFRIFWHCCRV